MPAKHPLRLMIGAASAAVLAGAFAFAAPGAAASTGTHGAAARWVATWAASAMAATPPSLAAPDDFSSAGFDNQTVRDIVWTSVGGRAARIRLSNRFGTQPVTFSQADVGISAGGAAVVPGTNHPVTFAGSTSVTIAPGAAAVSDPVRMAVPAETDLAVSLFTAGPTGPATYHSDAQQVNYVSTPGDYAASADGSAFTTTSQHWYFLDDIDVQVGPQVRGTIVAFGDSITDGFRSTVNANARWPNDLARRLLAGPPGLVHPVVDEGISGNRVLNDSACFGINAQARFLRDVAARTAARYVILLEGINDIGFSQLPDTGCAVPNTNVSAAQIIAGYENIIAAAHAAGLKIFGATLTPFQGAAYYSAAGEAKREAVNNFIRTSGAFDGVIDFDKAVRDPADPLRILPAYDSGDHLHPNDAGYQAMANAVNLALFRP
ncbi:MAG TPA: SGNH/GDSL hydrolase family protein [Streptosporangiaceae bacterium]|jgi:lysophospholipase L1-like esterase|nr:SGNH/GDSL hydrolase family protein [Streptosporangiaceae bacterium]